MSKLVTRSIARAAALCLGYALLTSGPAAADEVFDDDVIITGSECVGAGCADGEDFNLDVLRLKDGNNRIGFIDGSAAPFPTRDWRIEANSIANGGPSYLALKDMGDTSDGSEGGTPLLTLSAGAPANSIFVSGSGRVGLGTSTPARNLHVIAGAEPTIRLEQDGSGGFTPQTWDVGGNHLGFFVLDADAGQVPFQILPNAGDNRLVLRNTGVGIGTDNPSANLEMVGGTGFKGSFLGATVEFLARGDLGFAVVGTDTNHPLHLRVNNTPRMVLATSGNVGVGTQTPAAQFHTTGTVRLAGVANCASGIRSSAAGDLSCIASSAQLKNIAGALSPEAALQNVMALRPQVGAYKDTPEEPEHWLIAEEVAEVDPALVGLKDGEPYTVKTYGVIVDLVAVIQQQQRRIETQQAESEAQRHHIEKQQALIEAQAAQFEAQHRRIAALEQAIVQQ
ncbi:MAG: hypothetical protein ACRED5_14040 [Propylenella sp.]